MTPLASRTSSKTVDFRGHTVHLVFSNHLDVGFTDLDNEVINLYFHTHYPAAIKLAKQLQAAPDNTHGDRFRYLTHSWLISLFFDCPPGLGVKCPNATHVADVQAAIEEGVITWHAIPFNPQYEVFDADLLAAAVDLTHGLDARFGQHKKRMVSLRDVPGLTRASIPVLASKGVRGITGGVNAFSAPPGVPKNTPFIWRDEESGTQLLAMWHPGGYSGSVNGTLIDSRQDCVTAPGFKHALCVSWRNDNLGPPETLEELQTMFAVARQQWPGATVKASSLDAYLEQLSGAVEAGEIKLPVVTGEIGDTWIHGIASDPGRMASYRATLRARHTCRHTPHCDSESPAFHNFTRMLVKVAEHTWGVSFNQYFNDFSNYTNAWLHQLLEEGEAAHANLAVCVESWRRQRQYVDWALEALPLKHPIRAYLLFCSKHWLLQVDPETGGLWRLQRMYSKKALGNDWAAGPAAALTPADQQGAPVMKSDSAAAFKRKGLDVRSSRRRQRQGQASTSAGSSCGSSSSSSSSGEGLTKRRKPAAAFGQVQYNVYNPDDYQFVWDNYAMLHPVWVGDFGKQNMSASSNLSAQAQAKLEQVFHKEDKTLGLMLHLKLSFPDRLVQLAGAPAAAWLVLHAPPDTPQLHVTLAWQNKTVTRLPEALWLRFRPGPGAVDEESWVMKKMDSHIKPQEIIVNGSHALHAVSQGVSVLSRDHSEQLHISTLDVSLVNLGRPNPFPNPCDGPDMAHGVSFNIVNTIWGTNFAMWMHNPKDANMAFRFVLEADRMSSREGSRPQPA
ncbi:hypothetical protein OEZ85_005961 [Tetradesmus obliquus]|uniref:Glycoside hydrolase family 38 N-terminal domain-containing protein n=1 Tax=Tetradesmus obliquus TaxID=3088 RepID=A0ABY8UF61_TETOB|nr:hypothetical protein OEZ85_005961 [Tetradesmus obliquus]